MSGKYLLLPRSIEVPLSVANKVDPDQTPHSAASDLGLHCLPMSFYVKLGFNGLIIQLLYTRVLRIPPKQREVEFASVHFFRVFLTSGEYILLNYVNARHSPTPDFQGRKGYTAYMYVYVCMCAFVCAWVRVCVRACVRACVRVCVCVMGYHDNWTTWSIQRRLRLALTLAFHHSARLGPSLFYILHSTQWLWMGTTKALIRLR